MPSEAVHTLNLCPIRKNSKGFQSEKEIIEWFEQFGTPHKESEGKTWARFRMGRGQLFAFGKNTWRTGEFRMVVDIQKWGLEYELETGLDHFPGCRIEVELYQPMFGDYPAPYKSQSQFKSVIRKQVLFMEGSVLVDGDQINTPASLLEWDQETDEWYFSFGHGSNFAWYNIGAFVNEWSVRRAGVTGVAVSKVAVDVNFARNDIKDSCPVYQHGKLIVSANKIKKVRKAQRRLNENEKVSTIIDLRDGECDYNEVKTLGLFMTCDDKTMSLDAIRKIRSPWTFAPKDSRIADKLQQAGKSICLSDEILNDLEFVGEPERFFNWLLMEADKNYYNGKPLLEIWSPMARFYRPFNGDKGLSSGYSDTYAIIPTERQTKAEKRFLKVMQDIREWDGRILCLGVSDTAAGWTDGHSYIAFDRNYLKRHFPSSSWGAAAMATLAMHEMAHDDDDTGSHIHGTEFYQAYHDLTMGESLYWIATLAYKMRSQKNEDQASLLADKEAKKEAQREKKLGLAKAQKRIAAAPAGLTHTPTNPKPAKVVKKKRVRRRW